MAAFKSNRRNSSRRIANSTAKFAMKGIEESVKWMAKDHTGYSRNTHFMGLMWRGHCSLARLKLANRRHARADRRIDAGEGWIIDHLLFLWDVIWGMIKSFLIFLLSGIVGILITLLFYYVVIAGAFWMLMCDQVPSQAAMP